MARKSNGVPGAVTAGSDLLGRPLTARSVVASLLLGRHPPAAPAALLVRWCALFGISETSARVALTRMAQAGEVRAADGTYELVGRIRERQAEQDFAITPRVSPWSGAWLVAISPAGSRPARERVELRRSMTHLRMRPLRDGVWTRPDNLAVPHVDGGVSGRCIWMRAVPTDAVAGDLVTLWDLPEFDSRTETLLRRLQVVNDRLPADVALAEAFVTGAAAAQHLRRDPLLPEELLPTGWRGNDLRATYAAFLREFNEAVAAWAASR